MEARMLIVSY
uniref:Uncharacterized protein n=1 Tax=Arundo donax TaxID=35708 RepID=A0A0A8ZHX5_ARUDO